MIRPRELKLPWKPGGEAAYLRSREWLVTNGLGGYASGTIAGVPTRKYHGLLVPNLSRPKGRHILISRCDESVTIGDNVARLGGAEFAGDHTTGESHLHLEQFRLNRRSAIWAFRVQDCLIEKCVSMPHNQNTVCVKYRLLRGSPVDLDIRPYLSFRRHDETPKPQSDAVFTLRVTSNRHEVWRKDCELVLRMMIQPGRTIFVTDETLDNESFYRTDFERGDVHLESAYSPGYFQTKLTAEHPVVFVASSQSWESLEIDGSAVCEAEERRVDGMLSGLGFREDPFAAQLAMATDQFIIWPAARRDEAVMAEAGGGELRTVIAGYHWFGDWGRDTMISLEGLALCTGRFREAGAILRTFAGYVKDGLLPNLFPEGERQALYHTVDASLWYFHAIARYIEHSGDREIVRELFAVLESIVEHHLRGTHFNIHVDPDDGLVAAAAEGYQLTWMDAKVDGWVVTPRRGKPVEIEALWHNALMLMAQWAREAGKAPERYEQLALRARESFNRRYWNEARGCLYDVIDGPNGDDAALRPNQIFSISLSHPVLARERWQPVLDVVERELLTPYGLRTLSRDHPDYKARYRGDLRQRDAAYHQGTVWPWLIGHFVDAYLKCHSDTARARSFLQAFPDHLNDAGVGSISEVFDAEEPHTPGGCIAQAWSVAEVLRAQLLTR